MQENTKQRYGIFVQKLNVFMYVEATRQEFERILEEFNMDPKSCCQQASTTPYIEKFDDFDSIVEEVSNAADDPLSLDLHEFDF